MDRDQFGRFKKGYSYVMSDKHKTNISKALIGNKHGFKEGNTIQRGIKRSVKTVEKMKNSHIGLQPMEKNPNWKGGISNIVKRIREMPEYKNWRDFVFKRDNWTCQHCRNRSKQGDRIELEAHHKKRLIIILRENKINNIYEARKCKEMWDKENGQTLCKRCHEKTKGNKKQIGKENYIGSN
jgi:hypothetical protein